jgi:hypothetical protein
MGIMEADGKTASFHLGFEVENPKGLHAIRRHCVLVVDDSDVPKPESLDQGLYDLVVCDRTVCFRCQRCRHQGLFFAANRPAVIAN